MICGAFSPGRTFQWLGKQRIQPATNCAQSRGGLPPCGSVSTAAAWLYARVFSRCSRVHFLNRQSGDVRRLRIEGYCRRKRRCRRLLDILHGLRQCAGGSGAAGAGILTLPQVRTAAARTGLLRRRRRRQGQPLASGARAVGATLTPGASGGQHLCNLMGHHGAGPGAC